MDLQSKVSELSFSKEVKTCEEDESLGNVISQLQDAHIGSIVITKNNLVQGIFTERDFLFKIGKDIKELSKKPISEFMTKNPVSVTDGTSVVKVLELMHEGRFRHMLVTESNGELVGIISIKDLMEFLIGTVKTLEEDFSDLVSAIV